MTSHWGSPPKAGGKFYKGSNCSPAHFNSRWRRYINSEMRGVIRAQRALEGDDAGKGRYKVTAPWAQEEPAAEPGPADEEERPERPRTAASAMSSRSSYSRASSSLTAFSSASQARISELELQLQEERDRREQW